jgi:beta-glucanase (GH16 family)
MILLLPLLLETAAPPALAPPSGYRLVWRDEFSGRGLPDASRWSYDTAFNKRGWHNEEKQYYSAARSRNGRVRRGRLIIEAHRERLARRSDWGGQEWSSARLVTRGKARWTYGFFEVRAKLPCAVGSWPAVWLLADTPKPKWPDDGEIDVMEHVGFEPETVHHSVHTAAFNHRKGTHKTASSRVPGACGFFRNYQLLWTATTIRMGVDGREIFRFDRTPGAGRDEWPFDGPQYLILNLAVGGTWAGRQGVDAAAFPARMEVDYVRVWQAPAAAGGNLAQIAIDAGSFRP